MLLRKFWSEEAQVFSAHILLSNTWNTWPQRGLGYAAAWLGGYLPVMTQTVHILESESFGLTAAISSIL